MYIFKDPVFLATLFLTSLIMTLLSAVPAYADDEISDEMIQLSTQIVRDYRELRTSCSEKEGESRKMCYYRLRIGLWDYKQARETLSKEGIHRTSELPDQVAQH
ncbi:hypothetical protein [Pseudomaricurvus sp.]|uniref:hypothetical protein n=1 Tax=Pseudomaricurvus sp. TaxID=2004510 RepID=UPI003F6AD91E